MCLVRKCPWWRRSHSFVFVNDISVQELTMDKVNLVWHPSPDGNTLKGSSKSPVSVRGWFEMGSRLYNRVIQPKFMWRETTSPIS